jgi:hypothetical protein
MKEQKIEINMETMDTTITKKKRGRRPRYEKKNEVIDGININILENKKIINDNELDNRNNIIHLKINKYTTVDNINNTELLSGYDKEYEDEFSSNPQKIETISNNIFKDIDHDDEHHYNMNTCCYWCCHIFNNLGIGLPIKYINNVFYTFGHFCSIECMCAYNFYSNEVNYNKWEIYGLINLLNKKLGNNSIKLAPPRQSLIMFGGTKTIEEYRASFNIKNIILHTYPMVNITNNIEELNNILNMKYIDNTLLNKKKLSYYEIKRKQKVVSNLNNDMKNILQEN